MKLKYYTIAAVLFCMLSLLSACGRRKDIESVVTPPHSQKALHELVDEDVIVRINNKSLTVKDIKKEFNNFKKLIAWQKKGIDEQRLAMAVDRSKQTFLSQYINKEAVLVEAQRLKLEPSKDNRKQASQVHSASVNSSGLSFDEYCSILGFTVDEYKKRIEQDAIRLAVRDKIFNMEINITDEQLEAEKARYRNYNQGATATNAAVMENGVRIVKELRDGGDFAALARKYSESPNDEDGVSWGEFVRGDFENLQVRNAAFTLPVGGVSDPIDMEEGLLIIKVLKRDETKGGEGEFTQEVELARILLRMVREFTLPEDAELKDHMFRSVRDDLYSKKLQELCDKCDIIYPSGTNVLSKLPNLPE